MSLPVLLAFLFAAAALASPASATTVQVTDIADADCRISAPRTNSAGSRVVFDAACDFGTNADLNHEIFAAGLDGTIEQLTDTQDCTNSRPSISDFGSVVAFESDCDEVSTNSDRNVEIFVHRQTGVTQLTSSQACANRAPDVTGSGTDVFFDSDCDLVAGQNADRSIEIFRATLASGLTQITDDRSSSGCGSFNASAGRAASGAAFESDCDLVGENEDQVIEIFVLQPGSVIAQVTKAPVDTCLSTGPALDGDGDSVAFESDCDLAGLNDDESVEVFRAELGGSAVTVTQLSDDGGDPACESARPRISDSGETVVFSSFCDPQARNADRSLEVFAATGTALTQITSAAGCAYFAPEIGESSSSIIWAGDCDPAELNADGSDELFTESACACGAPQTRFRTSDTPTAADALLVLQAGTGSRTCAACDCDVNDDMNITASDALLILKRAVGQEVELVCSDGA